MTARYRILPREPALPDDLAELLSEVETSTIGHVEVVGFIGGGVRPIAPARAVGGAVTVAAPGRDGAVIYKAIDLVMPGDVLVIARVDRDDIACVGGGVATAAKAKGAAAIVVDGPCTDLGELMEAGLPVWCNGVSAKTTNREFMIGGAVNVPIACGGAAVLPGYAVLADTDGVFVAESAHMRTLAIAARERQTRSRRVRDHLAQGKSIFDFR
jgi:4-hydroxy-4-methyl-2-oxoglutarate aldolase